MELAEHFKTDKRLDKLKKDGKLPTGNQTTEVFKKAPHQCVGKAGDVFLANYMTAHFIAPNTAADIRYALYFRVQGDEFHKKQKNGHCSDSMLDPWVHWPIMKDVKID